MRFLRFVDMVPEMGQDVIVCLIVWVPAISLTHKRLTLREIKETPEQYREFRAGFYLVAAFQI